MVLLTAVAVAETLIGAAGLPATIKWPNDVLVRGRKIAGILAEMAVEMDAVDYMVIGVGLNVNTPARAFPQEFRGRATSVLTETGRSFSRVLILQRFLEWFEKYYDLFRKAGFEPIMARWGALTDMVGKRVEVQTIGGHFEGEVAGFDPDGFLILRDRAGGEQRLLSGDVTLI
jgi:BirA family biotin operon repressor/biotin-[acetyl-CoA-carboxylase] ligase